MHFLILCWILSFTDATSKFHLRLKAKSHQQRQDRLRIATYNAEWLFSPVNKQGHKIALPKACPRKDWISAKKHIQEVASTLSKISFDILIITEVQGVDILKLILSQMTDGVEYKCHVTETKDTSHHMCVGLITRIKPASNPYRLEDRQAYSVKRSRIQFVEPAGSILAKNLVAKFHIPLNEGILKLAVIGVHFKSGAAFVNSAVAREAQALIVKRHTLELQSQGYKTIIAGDMNDFDKSTPGLKDPPSITRTLSILKSAGHKNHSRKIPLKERYTTEMGTQMDYILTHRDLPVSNVNIYKMGPSDHYPVLAEINLKKFD